jgi:protoporphyrinogen oxidase
MKVLIVGAGVAGLTAAHELSSKGHEVTVLEKEKEIGGLAKTYRYGEFIFDSGPHRFFTTDEKVTSFIKDVLGDDLIIIPKRSGVMLLGKYYDWPLTLKTVLKFPVKIMISIALDMVFKKSYEGPSFKAYILNKYGQTLYELDFGPYTEKFTKIPNEYMHSDWAESGVNQAVIDKRIKMDTTLKIITSLFKKKETLPLIYPPAGIAKFNEKLAAKITLNGGQILTGQNITDLICSEKKIDEIIIENTKFPVDKIIWTAPITDLFKLQSLPVPDLKFIAIVLFNIEVNEKPNVDYQWCYYIDKEVVFNRSYIPVLWSKSQAPENKHGICLEVTCMEGDSVWQNPESLLEKVKQNLLDVGLVKERKSITGIHIEKIKDAYPIYEIQYRDELEKSKATVSKYENLILAGRCGLFWYNNMDHSIGNALEISQKLTDKTDKL